MYRFIKNPDPRKNPPFGSILDPHHPLSHGLVGFLPLNEDGGNIVWDLSTNISPLSLDGQTWTPNGLQFNNNGQVFFGVGTYGNLLNGAAGITLSTSLLAFDYSPDNYRGRIFGNHIAAGNGIASWLDVAGNLVVGGRSLSTDGFQSATIAFPGLNRLYHTVGMLDFVNKTISIYIDGKLVQSTDVTFGGENYVQGTATLNDSMGGRENVDLNYYLGQINNFNLFGRSLNESEIQQLYAEPYANILVPQYWFMADFGAVATGWTGKICGVTNPSKICGIAVADIVKVSGI